MVAVVGVDAQLVDNIKGVLAPVFDVHKGVVQRRTVVAGKGIDFAQGLGGGENVRADDFVKQAGELGIGEADAVEGIEFLAEVLFQRGAIGDVLAVFVFEFLERADEAVFDAVLSEERGRGLVWRVVAFRVSGHGGQLKR